MQRLLYNIIINIILKIFKSRFGFTVKHVFGRKSATNWNPQYARVVNINIILFWGHQPPPMCGKEKGRTHFLVHHKQHISRLHINFMFGYTIWCQMWVFFWSNMILVKFIVGLYIGLNSSIQNRLVTCKGVPLFINYFQTLSPFNVNLGFFPIHLLTTSLCSCYFQSVLYRHQTSIRLESIKNDFFLIYIRLKKITLKFYIKFAFQEKCDDINDIINTVLKH